MSAEQSDSIALILIFNILLFFDRYYLDAMRYLMLMIFIFGFNTLSSAQEEDTPGAVTTEIHVEHATDFILDYTDPETVAKALIYAARNEDMGVLNNLCDPLLENDDYTESICLIEDPEKKKWVIKEFKDARLFSMVNDRGDIYTIKMINIEGGHSKDVNLTLIKRYGNWYLYSMD